MTEIISRLLEAQDVIGSDRKKGMRDTRYFLSKKETEDTRREIISWFHIKTFSLKLLIIQRICKCVSRVLIFSICSYRECSTFSGELLCSQFSGRYTLMGYIKSQDHGEIHLWASRRVRRFGRIFRQRLLLWLLALAVIFLICFTYFGVEMHFHGNFSSLENVREEPGVSNTEKQPKKQRRQRYFPCDVPFVGPLSYILEPEDIIKFARFSLSYVEREERNLLNEAYEVRFGGHQTLQDREKSYHARNQTIHCGFVRGPDGFPSTGFDLDENDKRYMNMCKIVVASCIFGSSDFLRRPTSKLISEYSKKNVCFVMFLDEQSLDKLSAEGNVPDGSGNIGLWKIVVVKNLPYEDLRKTGKVPKFLAHRLFPSSRYSIWLDSKLRLNADPLQIIEYFLLRPGSEYAISNHYARRCVWEEVLQNKRLNKFNHSAIDEQFFFYQSDGLTKYDLSGPGVPLSSFVPEGSFIVRAHTPMSNLFSCLWFNEVDRFTSRDQLSFAYTYLKLRRLNPDKPFYLNMFKDCERRAITKLFHHRGETQR